MCFAPQRRALFRHLNLQKWSVHGVFCTFSLRNVLRATTPCTFSTSQLPKVVREWCVLYILTSKCASRHNGVHFFDTSTSKSGPTMVCLVHFDFEMCFAPQRRALFQHLNFQSGPNPAVFNTFYFQMCFAPQRRALFNIWTSKSGPTLRCFVPFHFEIGFRATMACNFSSLISPDVSAPAALASLLFNPPEPQNHEKTQCFATYLPFRAPASSFFWSFLFWLFSLLTAFSSLHIVGSLTSKLPSISYIYTYKNIVDKSPENPLIIQTYPFLYLDLDSFRLLLNDLIINQPTRGLEGRTQSRSSPGTCRLSPPVPAVPWSTC